MKVLMQLVCIVLLTSCVATGMVACVHVLDLWARVEALEKARPIKIELGHFEELLCPNEKFEVSPL